MAVIGGDQDGPRLVGVGGRARVDGGHDPPHQRVDPGDGGEVFGGARRREVARVIDLVEVGEQEVGGESAHGGDHPSAVAASVLDSSGSRGTGAVVTTTSARGAPLAAIAAIISQVAIEWVLSSGRARRSRVKTVGLAKGRASKTLPVMPCVRSHTPVSTVAQDGPDTLMCGAIEERASRPSAHSRISAGAPARWMPLKSTPSMPISTTLSRRTPARAMAGRAAVPGRTARRTRRAVLASSCLRFMHRTIRCGRPRRQGADAVFTDVSPPASPRVDSLNGA